MVPSQPVRGIPQLCGFNLMGTQFHHLENRPTIASISKGGYVHNKVRAVREDTVLTQVYGHGGLEHLGHWARRPGGARGDRTVAGVGSLARLCSMAAGWSSSRTTVWRGVLRVGGQIFGDAAVTGCRRPERRAGH